MPLRCLESASDLAAAKRLVIEDGVPMGRFQEHLGGCSVCMFFCSGLSLLLEFLPVAATPCGAAWPPSTQSLFL